MRCCKIADVRFWLALLVLLLAILHKYGQIDLDDLSMTEPIDKAKFVDQLAFVVGYTGESGKELVRVLLEKKVFQKLVLIGRRQVDFGDDPLYKNIEQKVVDFDKLEEFKDVFHGPQVGYCCLGTTRGKSGVDGFYKVDHDYIMGVAKMAKESGIKHFNLVSSAGANANSMVNYLKVKGQVENEIKDLKFENYTIWRPATLLCDREERRTGEKIFRTILKPIAALSPTLMSVPTVSVAKAMMLQSFIKTEEPIKIVENRRIHELAALFDKEFA